MQRTIAALVPYIAVSIGMYVFHSAWLAVLLYHIGILAFLFRGRPNLSQKLKKGWKSPLLIPGVIGCSLAAPVIYFMWPWFAASNDTLPEWMAQYGLTGMTWLLLMPYFSIVHPILEEFHWRGLTPGKVPGPRFEDLMFAGYHVLVLHQLIYWPWLFFVFAVLVCSSVFWRWTTERDGGYVVSICTHTAADAGVIIAVHLLL